MCRYFLKEVEVEGFRGINNSGNPLKIGLETNAINSIFAPNAQGKSSLYEALLFSIKGEIPKLTRLHAAEQASEYYVNRFHKDEKATIQLTFEPDDGSDNIKIVVNYDQKGTLTYQSPTGERKPKEFLESLDNEFCFLDDRTFRLFIEETPLARGRTFSSLLGLGALSEIRQALEVLSYRSTCQRDFDVKSLNEEKKSLDSNRKNAEMILADAYRKVTNKEIDLTKSHIDSKTDVLDVLKNIPLFNKLLETTTSETLDFETLINKIRESEKSDDQAKLVTINKEIIDLEVIKKELPNDAAWNALEELAKQRTLVLQKTKGQLLKDLYNIADKIITSAEWDDNKACPLCDTKLENDIAQIIKPKIEEYARVEEATKTIQDNWKSSAIPQAITSIRKREELKVDQKTLGEYDKLNNLFVDGNVVDSDVTTLKELYGIFLTALDAEIERAKKEQQKLQSKLPPSMVKLTEQVNHASLAYSEIDKIKLIDESIGGINGKQAKINEWINFIEEASNIFSEAEVKLSTEKMKALESDYQDMYEKITSNPNITPKLEKASGSEELYLKLENFYGKQDLTAATLLSESYKNALAISIFLSSALQHNSTSRFMVLDDITSSFDAGHQYALMELIKNNVGRPTNASGPQILLLSHDGLLEKYLDKVSRVGVWKHQKIVGLAPNGTIFTQAQDADRLKNDAQQFLNAGQIAEGKPLVRQYLEFKLLEVIRKVNISVPLDFAIRDDKKMVENALNAIKGELQLHQKAGTLIMTSTQQSTVLNALIPALIGNWISHYATGSTVSVTPHVLLNVINEIDAFSDSFKYDCTCSGTIARRFYKNLANKHCSC